MHDDGLKSRWRLLYGDSNPTWIKIREIKLLGFLVLIRTWVSNPIRRRTPTWILEGFRRDYINKGVEAIEP